MIPVHKAVRWLAYVVGALVVLEWAADILFEAWNFGHLGSSQNDRTTTEVFHAAAALLGTCFTAWAAWASSRAARAAESATLLANDSMLLLERPIVDLKEIRVENEPEKTRIKLIPIWLNSGRTVARHAVQNSVLVVRGDIENMNFLQDFELTKFVISPGVTVGGGTLYLPHERLEKLTRGEETAFVWGWTEYEAFLPGSPRFRTEYCYRLVFSGSESGEVRIEFVVAADHNAMDEDCLPIRYRTTKGGVPNASFARQDQL